MKIPTDFTLLNLKEKPLQIVTLSFKTNFPILMARFKTRINCISGVQNCTVFEMVTPHPDDLILVNGHRESFLLRDEVLWPLRLMATAMNSQVLSYAPSERASIARIRPIQSALSCGYLKLKPFAFIPESSMEKMTFAELKKIEIKEADAWSKRYDLVQVCDYIKTDWRLVRTADELRQQDTFEQLSLV